LLKLRLKLLCGGLWLCGLLLLGIWVTVALILIANGIRLQIYLLAGILLLRRVVIVLILVIVVPIKFNG
jgi:hypothetical protein